MKYNTKQIFSCETHVIVTVTQYGIHQVQNDDATGTLEITAIPFIALVANPHYFGTKGLYLSSRM
jgi:hypothetical protein